MKDESSPSEANYGIGLRMSMENGALFLLLTFNFSADGS